jgi:hypothetical protein
MESSRPPDVRQSNPQQQLTLLSDMLQSIFIPLETNNL